MFHPKKQYNALFPESNQSGFTLIEVLVTIVIISVLASIALPMAQLAVQRSKEQALKRELRTIRDAIDAYKQAVDKGKIARRANESGYPPTLEKLVDGVPNAESPEGAKIYLLRRIPRDPFSDDFHLPAAETWGKRSYASSNDDPKEGPDVYDIYSLAPGKGLNGLPYRDW